MLVRILLAVLLVGMVGLSGCKKGAEPTGDNQATQSTQDDGTTQDDTTQAPVEGVE